MSFIIISLTGKSYKNMYEKQTYSLIDSLGKRKYLNGKERDLLYTLCTKLENEMRLFFLVIHWTGSRISEALQLCPGQLDMADETINVKSLKKRGKVEYRPIPVPPPFLMALRDFVKGMDENRPIWRFSRRTASRHIKKLMNLAGIEGARACARGMRHGYAVHCVMKELPLPTIKKLMGHESVETTMIYTKIFGPEERRFVKRLWEDTPY